MRFTFAIVVSAIVFSTVLIGCQSAYYGAWEKLGYHKRDILIERVEAARDDQQEAKEQFQTALEAFQSVVAFDGGDLQATYERLNREYERSADRAADVRERIESIDSVATALFEEWEAELEQYANDSLRRQSEEQLEQTRDRYRDLHAAMTRAESRMEPVLTALNDQVLFLKHNLNAQAIASLQGEVITLEGDIDQLVADMEAAIAEADAFISAIRG